MAIIITQKEAETKGQFIAKEENVKAGEMTYSILGQGSIIIDHTEVGENFGGKGVGMQLLRQVVDYARVNEKKIIPICPFARAMMEKHEELQDVLRK